MIYFVISLNALIIIIYSNDYDYDIYKVCKLSNETDLLFTKVFIIFKHQCFTLQNSSHGQLHTNGDIVPTFVSSTGSLQLI